MTSTALPDEVAKFSALADQWWDPEGPFRPLHKLNPARLLFIRDRLADHFGRNVETRAPFDGLTLLDIGCGGGLTAEPMARLGFRVTAIDASEENVGVAHVHAERLGLDITYETATPEELVARRETFDAVLALEVVEHVADIESFLSAAAACVKPNGAFVAATLNRTLKSLALGKVAAEYILRWVPAGTHDWRKFVRPSELARGFRRAGLHLEKMEGVHYDVMTDRWRLGPDLDVNYMAYAKKAAA